MIKYLGVLVSGVLLLRFSALIVQMALMIPVQTDITFPEGALVARAMDVARGQSPYHDWRVWPHHFAPYPPLAYYPVGWGARGLDLASDTHAVYMIGRGFSFAMMLGVFGVVFLLGRRLGLPLRWSLCAVALLAELRILLEYCTSYRPDAPKTLFALLALWIAARSRPTARAVAAALGCLLVSAWFKPTAWGVGLLIAWWVWRGLGARRALAVGGLFLAAGLVPLWLLDRHWHGLLLLNIVDSLRNTLEMKTIFTNIKAIGPVPTLLMMSGAMAGGWALRRTPDPGTRLLLAAAPLTLFVSLFQLLKVGADVNYFLDSFPLTVLAAVWFAHRLWRGEFRFSMPRHLALGVPVLVLLSLILYHAALETATCRDSGRTLKAVWTRTSIQNLARAVPGPVLTTNSFVAMESAAPTILDYFQYTVLCRRGSIDPEGLLDRLRRREFGAVLLLEAAIQEDVLGGSKEVFCQGFLKTLAQSYGQWRPMGVFRVYLAPAALERLSVRQ